MESGWFDLTGRVALVTGAARGLGAAAASALAAAGASVVVTDLDAESAAAQALRLRPTAAGHASIALDVSNADQRAAARDLAAQRYGRLDILVNNAGIMLRKPAVATTDTEFLNILNVNLVAALTMAGLAAPLMIEGGYGRIINLSSILGVLGRGGVATYSAAKAGLAGLTRALAGEFGPSGLTVNAIAPGYLMTEMNGAILDDRAFYESVVARTPLRRWGTAEDIEGIVLFLASPGSAFVTGQTILLDGGMGVTLPGSPAVEAEQEV